MKRFLIVFIASSVLVGTSIFLYHKLYSSPDARILLSNNHATWIQASHEFDNRGRTIAEQKTIFVKFFEIESDVRKISVELKVIGRAELLLDGTLLYETTDPEGFWKQEATVVLPEVGRGSHEISMKVSNDSGPMLMLIDADKINISSDHTWEVISASGSRLPVMSINDPIKMPKDVQDGNVFESIVVTLPVSITIFVLFGLLAINRRVASILSMPAKRDIFPHYFRVFCHTLWLILAVNCLSIPPDFGFDYQGHMDYIGYIAINASLPLADQGWQMFQTPLYYIVSAAVFKVGQLFATPYTPAEILRVIPLACGFAQIEIGYRTMRTVFPQQTASQIIGLSLITFMPMHLYMSQQLGNEIFAAVFVSATIFYVTKFIKNPEQLLSHKEQFVFSVVLSAAILSKISALLLIIPTVFYLVLSLQEIDTSPKKITLIGLKITTFILILTGWYFIRNLFELGQLFVNGWSAFRGITWWQEPGYRTLRDFTEFGHSFFNPVLASVYGFWDSLYSTMWFDGLLSGLGIGSQPPWNYKYALPVVWFSMVPSLAILVGIFQVFNRKSNIPRPFLIYSASCVSLYVLAIAYLYATLPIYSTAKATYMLGLLPCFGILGASGFAYITKIKVLRVIMLGLFGCWVVFSYKGYLMIG